jgi:hypothetical protein
MKKQGLKQILLTLMISLLLPLFQVPALGQSSLLLPDYPASHVVTEDDTLWTIASQFLRDPERWPEVWTPDTYLDDSDLIYPGDILLVSFDGGSPRILMQRGDRMMEKLSPSMRPQTLTSAIPAIPLEAIENSFSRNRIVTHAEFDAAPYIVANTGNNLAIGTGDEVFARGIWPTGTSTFEIYRAGRHYWDASGEVDLGLEVEYLGFASIEATESDGVNRMLINNSSKEIRVGDRLLIREHSRINATIFPTEPASHLQGEIIAFLNNDSLASQLDTVVINLGLRDNLEIGNILSIRQPGVTMTDEVERSRMSFKERFSNLFKRDSLQLPAEEIGVILVYKTFEQVSYAVIIDNTAPAKLHNPVVSP